MKSTLLIALSFVTFASASAFSMNARKLSAVMKDISRDYKAIGKQIDDPSKNQSSVLLSHELGSFILEARSIMPPSIASMPPQNQAQAMAGYQQEIDDLSAACTKMESAFQQNDNPSAQAAYDQMADIKSDGHDKYKQ